MRTVKLILAVMIAGFLLGFFLIPADLGDFRGTGGTRTGGTGTSSAGTLTVGTGAGDADRVVTDELRRIVTFACTAASLSTQKHGGISSVPSEEEVLAKITED